MKDMDVEKVTKIKNIINQCLLPKLAKNYEESENHPEFELRNKSLKQNIYLLEQALIQIDLNKEKHSSVIASILMLYLELQSESSWNNLICKQEAQKLNCNFIQIYGVPLECILYKSKNWNMQDIFDLCAEDIHKKLTEENFKKYPGQIDVYCFIMKDLKKYPVTRKPTQLMPISLLLMDDYVNYNKRKGLECCLHILQCLQTESFKDGNYYEVIYRSLKKLLYDKEIEITKLTYSCLLEISKILPYEVKDKKLDELYCISIEQLSTESSLHRKSECLGFTTTLITMQKTNCINRSDIKAAICDCLDVCTENAVAEILLKKTLRCLDEWIKYCWCVWRFSTDHKMISILLKVLYTCKDEKLLNYIQQICSTLCILCTTEEQEKILSSIQENYKNLPKDFCEKLDKISKSIKI